MNEIGYTIYGAANEDECNHVLSIAEMRNLPVDDRNETPVWVEYRINGETAPVTLIRAKAINPYEGLETYNVTWRCWKEYPSFEERKFGKKWYNKNNSK